MTFSLSGLDGIRALEELVQNSVNRRQKSGNNTDFIAGLSEAISDMSGFAVTLQLPRNALSNMAGSSASSSAWVELDGGALVPSWRASHRYILQYEMLFIK
ncbi:MAG: hypothetical protein R2911_14860 [Caldilineaceae bacterium]